MRYQHPSILLGDLGNKSTPGRQTRGLSYEKSPTDPCHQLAGQRGQHRSPRRDWHSQHLPSTVKTSPSLSGSCEKDERRPNSNRLSVWRAERM